MNMIPPNWHSTLSLINGWQSLVWAALLIAGVAWLLYSFDS